MKFTIATIHNAYGLSHIPDGIAVEMELSNINPLISLVDVNWLKPVDNNQYIADILFEDNISKLNKVESALEYYFTEQFDDNSSRLLWMPTFHKMHMFCKCYLKNKSVFDIENTIFSRVINKLATEVDVLVFTLGDKSLTKLGSPKFAKERFVVNDINVQILSHEITKKSDLFEDLLKYYSLSVIGNKESLDSDVAINNNPILIEQFSKYGKLESI